MSDTATSATADLKTAFDAMKNAGARSLRQSAWDAFSREGLPNRRVEAWHYTDLRAALRGVAPLRAAGPATPALERGESCRFVVLDGAFRPDLSDVSALPYGVSVLSLREALARGEAEILAALAGDAEDPTLALNAALMQDGAVLRVSPGCVLERPLEFANFVSGGAARSVYTRSLAILGAGARATLLESFTPLERSGAQENHALVMRPRRRREARSCRDDRAADRGGRARRLAAGDAGRKQRVELLLPRRGRGPVAPADIRDA